MYYININKLDNKDTVKKIIDTILIKTNLYSVKDAVKRNEIEIKIKMIYVLSNKYLYTDNCIEVLKISDQEEININILIYKLDKYIISKLYFYYKEIQADAGEQEQEQKNNIIKIKVSEKKEKEINRKYNKILQELGYKKENDTISDIYLFKLYYNFFNYIYLNDYDIKDIKELDNTISKCKSLDIKTSIEIITNYLNNNIYRYLYNVMQDNKSIELIYS